MKWKHDYLSSQFHMRTEPELRQLLTDFDVESQKWGLPEPTLNCLGRTAAENKACGGVAHSLHLWEACPEDSSKPYRTRAADLSIRDYTPAHVELALTWLRGEVAKRGGRRLWELLFHDAGSGNHIHVARERDAGRE